jgi:hypothetical protein
MGRSSRQVTARARAGALVAVLLVLSGCDFSNRTGPAAAFTIALSSEILTIPQGGSGSVTVTLTRLNGLADAVSVLVEGSPAGVTAGALSIPAGQTTGTLTIEVASGAQVGSSTLTVHAHTSGPAPLIVTAALSLVVQPGGPGFELSFDPPIVGLPQGGSRTSTVTITRFGGLIGAVSLAASALPQGVTAFFNPASVSAPTATLTLTASATAATGAGTITVTGTATGVANRSATITVNVTPGGGAPTGNVSLSFCPFLGAPIWVAFQDGSGPWVLSTPVASAYTGQVSSGRGGVAWVVARPAGGFEINIRYGTTAELQAFGDVYCHGATGTGKRVNVTVSGVAASDRALLGLGTASTSFALGSAPPFDGVPDGSVDLVGARASAAGTAFVPDKLFIQRGITPAAGNTVTVDFAGTGALDPVSGTVTVANLGGTQAVLSTTYRTANRTLFQYSSDAPSASFDRPFVGFPTFPGSFHLVQVVAQSADRVRGAAAIHAAVGNRTLTLGPELGSITVAQAGTSPPLRLEAVVPATDYGGRWAVTFFQGAGAQYRSAHVQATSGYVGGSPSAVTLVVPDLSTAAGFNDLWGLAEAATTSWLAMGQNAAGLGAQGQWQDGGTLSWASRAGTFSHHQALRQRID